MNPVLLSSKNMNFRTPPEFLDVVRRFDRIALDPCAPPDNNTGAEVAWTERDDGLSREWWGLFGTAFVNPPYGRALPRWVQKMQQQAAAGAEIVALIPARTDTTYWQHAVFGTADRICFWSGRLTFWDIHPTTGEIGPAVGWNKKKQRYEVQPAAFPSAVVYWGARGERFREVFGPWGRIR